MGSVPRYPWIIDHDSSILSPEVSGIVGNAIFCKTDNLLTYAGSILQIEPHH